MNTKRAGKCINFGNCTKADNKEIIELEITEDFLCPECNSELQAEFLKRKDSGTGKKLIVGGAVLLLIASGAGYYFMQGQNKPDEIAIRKKTFTKNEGNTHTLDLKETSNSPVTASVKATDSDLPKPTAKPTQSAGDASAGTISVSGGSYSGQLQNGKPHGMGTLKYANRTLISKRDSKKRYADSGDYITGEFYEGELVQGQLFDSTNEPKEKILLGRVH